MKPVFLALCFSLVPLAAQASIGANGQDMVPPMPAGPVMDPATDRDGRVATDEAASGENEAATQRRSVLVRERSTDGPVLKLSDMYRVVGMGRADNCLAGTGTRIRRDGGGIGACATGNGRVFMPER